MAVTQKAFVRQMQASLLQRDQSETDDFWCCKLQLYTAFYFTVYYPRATVSMLLNTLGIYLCQLFFFFFPSENYWGPKYKKFPSNPWQEPSLIHIPDIKKDMVQIFQICSHPLYYNIVQSFHLCNVSTSSPVLVIHICSHKVTCCSILKMHLSFTTHFCPNCL